MDDNKYPIGNFILAHIIELQEQIESRLNGLSEHGEEWAVKVDYTFELSQERKIRDKFTVTLIPYIDEKRQGEYKFSFISLQTIFIQDICYTMYRVIYNPEKAAGILDSANVTIERL